MSEETVAQEPVEASVHDDPQAWLEKKKLEVEEGGEEQPGQSEAPPLSAEAEPAQAAPEASEPALSDWKSVRIPEDFEHKFFAGKTPADIYESYRHLEKDYRQKTERLSQAELKLSMADTLKEMLGGKAEPEAPKEPADEWGSFLQERGLDPDTDSILRPADVERARLEFMNREIDKRVGASISAKEQQRQEQLFEEARNQAITVAMREAGIPEDQMFFEGNSLYTITQEALKNGADPRALTDPNFLKPVLEQRLKFLGFKKQAEAPAAEVAEAPPPRIAEAANPPGAKRPVRAADPPNASASVGPGRLKEIQRMASTLGDANGWDEDTTRNFINGVVAREAAKRR